MNTYMINLGEGLVTLDGLSPVTLRAAPPRHFRTRRLIIRAVSTPLPWVFEIMGEWLAWVRVPWLLKHWSDAREEVVWRFRLIRPAALLLTWADRRAQHRALERCYVRDIRVAATSALIGRANVPAVVFDARTATLLNLPVCGPEEFIEVVLVGEGGPLAVAAIGDMEAPA